ncbi:MAG: hypothetical protein K6A90_09755, partial [Lachnospiraceae bacterium]|nr:hypothetical protein [Lachnospiraceae bacterium]
MKRKTAFLILGMTIALAACGSQQAAKEPAGQEAATAEQVVTAETKETEAAAEDSATEEAVEEYEDDTNYVEDMELSTDLLTITVPEEFKGKFLAAIDGEYISFYDKESHESGFGGYAFSVVVDKDKD